VIGWQKKVIMISTSHQANPTAEEPTGMVEERITGDYEMSNRPHYSMDLELFMIVKGISNRVQNRS